MRGGESAMSASGRDGKCSARRVCGKSQLIDGSRAPANGNEVKVSVSAVFERSGLKSLCQKE